MKPRSIYLYYSRSYIISVVTLSFQRQWLSANIILDDKARFLCLVRKYMRENAGASKVGNKKLVWFGLVSLFNDISTLFRLFNAEAILLEEQ